MISRGDAVGLVFLMLGVIVGSVRLVAYGAAAGEAFAWVAAGAVLAGCVQSR